MYAVIEVGGKQQRVQQGDVIEAERQRGEAPGNELTFQPLLVVDDDGKPHHGKDIEKASVRAKVVSEGRSKKVSVMKYKSKTRYTRRGGHRQLRSFLEITEVKMTKRTTRKAVAEDVPDAGPAAEAAKEPAAEE